MRESPTKEEVKEAAGRAWHLLYEVSALRDVIDERTSQGFDGEQQEVLRHIMDEKLSLAFEAISLVDDYFSEQPISSTDLVEPTASVPVCGGPLN